MLGQQAVQRLLVDRLQPARRPRRRPAPGGAAAGARSGLCDGLGGTAGHGGADRSGRSWIGTLGRRSLPVCYRRGRRPASFGLSLSRLGADSEGATPMGPDGPGGQPAFYDDLDLTLREAWQLMCRGVADRRSACHIADAGDGRASTARRGLRTVVLRGAEPAERSLRHSTPTAVPPRSAEIARPCPGRPALL